MLLQTPFPGIAQEFERRTSLLAAVRPPALGAYKDLPSKGLGMGPAMATLGMEPRGKGPLHLELRFWL